MIFHSLDYLVFLLGVLGVYWCLRKAAQNFFLIAASLVFYGFIHPWFLLPFAATTVTDYFVARGIEARPDWRRRLIGLSLAGNLGLLGVFKYFNFFVANVAALLHAVHLDLPLPVLRVVLPAGISFYTFQSIGYVVDVSRGHLRACRSFRDYALFVSFFPQLVAGPIQRAGSLLTQIQRPRTVTPALVLDASFLLIWGFFKKVVIADNVAITANKVFALDAPSFPILWIGVLAFCLQIFADFSAYTDIARGTARLFGFELSPNFHHPYLADSPGDFWRRWHISLSTWIRDYVFIPLGGSRGGAGRTALNLTIIFLLTGLWHGASWNFILWGFYYAALTLLYRAAAAVFPSWVKGFPGLRAGRVLLMFILTNIGWLIFRETHLPQLWHDLTLAPAAAPATDWKVAQFLGVALATYAAPLVLHTIWDTMLRERLSRSSPGVFVTWCAGTAVSTLLFAGILLLRSDTAQDFIYFQF